MTHVLFVCSKNQWRSPTAEAVFSNEPNLSVRSAGVSRGADVEISAEDVEWADIIFVMEPAHKRKLQQKFKPQLNQQRVICLGIPDDYTYMGDALVSLLKERVPKFLP